MANYQEYIGSIQGKAIQSGYFYQVTNTNDYQYVYGTAQDVAAGGVIEYRGGPIYLVPVELPATPVVAVNADTGLFSIGSVTYQFVGASENGEQLFFRPAGEGAFKEIEGRQYFVGARLYAISNTGPQLTITTVYDTHYTYNATSPLCFAAGTRILTPAGDVCVETLRLGDTVVTADGRSRPIRWIGSGTIIVTDANRPVVIRAGALGHGLPHRDLRVTQGHSFAFGDVLIPIGELVNGATICWDTASHVAIFHIELDRHALLIAEGAHAESYRNDGNRDAFAVGAGGGAARGAMPTCLPVVTSGPIVERTRRWLDAHGRRAPAAADAHPALTPAR